ncbi:hypothetical protein LJC01_03435 [Clostridiaceae bacterium OttesenSCG-928-D20]|nr:hypothetical protein [Clostridiaceae bacterium OttesenSCG-928-D20]
MKKIIVLTGGFGSGKTELSLNLALSAAKEGKTELIDLDMVNTYFRLSERRELIKSAEIRLVSPNYAMTNIESLSLPAEVSSAFDMDWHTVIFDAGGDTVGATALGRFNPDFMRLLPEQLEVYHVINVRRPLASTAEKIINLTKDLERNSRLKITGFINNTNLQNETTARELLDGYEILKEVTEKTAIPVAYTSGRKPILDEFLSMGLDEKYIGGTIELTTYMHRDWESFIEAKRAKPVSN